MIPAREREVLAALSINPAPTPDDVWRPSRYDVPELHERVVAEILRGVNRARHEDGVTPQMVAMQGRAGSGKTHLLGAVRERIQEDGGYFFLVGLINGLKFWESVALALVEGLGQPAKGWDTQLKKFHRELTTQLGLPADLRDVIAGAAPLTRDRLDEYISALRTADPRTGRESKDTARALVLLGSCDFDAQDLGRAFLGSQPLDEQDRRAWGIGPDRQPALIVRDISRLIALTLCPTVIAIDQIDTLFAQANASLMNHDGTDAASAAVVAPVADGLLTLRDTTRRTLTVISCLPDTWELLKAYAPAPVLDRIRLELLPDRIPTPEIGQAIIAKRLRAHFEDHEFEPPYEGWPIAPEAFADAVNHTPRSLLLRADQHVRHCVERDEVIELQRLSDVMPVGPSGPVAPVVPELDKQLVAIDARFAELVAAADVSAALDPATEDARMPALLGAGLAAWIDEQAPTETTYKYDPLPGRNPSVHGRLVRVLDATTENEVHWGFRLIGATNATAVISRVRNAMVKVGLDVGMRQRSLVLLRNVPWPSGPRTAEVLQAFRDAGGREYGVSEQELRILDALRALRDQAPAGLTEWLTRRKPTRQIAFFSDVLAAETHESAASDRTADGRAAGTAGHSTPSSEKAAGVGGPGSTRAGEAERAPGVGDPENAAAQALSAESAVGVSGLGIVAAMTTSPESATGVSGLGAAGVQATSAESAAVVGVLDSDGLDLDRRAVTLGRYAEDKQPFRVDLESLRRHCVIFAGSGSGKTVLIRRLVEECALAGVSSIVLDPNNDLARLGDAWPESPQGWLPGDDERARDYLDDTEVVVWTPRISAGRPLAFQPLPDFRSVRESPDEFDQAVRAAVAALAPRAAVSGETRDAKQGRAVLTEALREYARTAGAPSLAGFVDFFAELPDYVSSLARAEKLASDAAETLKAAMVTDPLFGGAGEAADPGVLLTPAVGKRARVSVISFAGLTSDEERQSFVNQLQMALFAWIKRHPAGDRPLGGLLVMDEAQTLAPATGNTPCTASSIALASQARKYGLGLVFATQAPKGLHNQISGNATTQFFGLLNHPTHLEAARELAAAKGGRMPDLGTLRSGQFYAAGEGFSFTRVDTPLCLSHHPKAPLSPEEVVARARH